MNESTVANNRLKLIWRVVIVVVALIIIGFLVYPLVQEQFLSERSGDTAPISTEAQALVTGPEATVQANPDSVEAWFNLGKAHYEAGQWAQAAAAFQKTVELDPTHQAAYANLGAAYHRQDQLDSALTQYQKALELNPDDGEVIYNLAAVYIQQATQSGSQPDADLLNQAIEQLHRALELAPGSSEPYFGLGVAYMALNQREQAIEAFETFLARDPGQDPRASQEAQRYLQMLRGQ
ncbi:MAG: tetratricopeptide repeat protein [Anaerolineae bacterium]|nr:tetratricopeptide repeat protein [Anaerolineae bacterium]